MRQIFTIASSFLLLFAIGNSQAQSIPEILYYKFDGTGTTVPNLASNPPAGTTTATLQGTITQGSNGQCGGALIGNGLTSTSNYVNTNWATNLDTSWTVSFWTSNIPSTTSTYYILGDVNAGGFRVFTGGVAGAGNWILRGGLTDVLATGGASTSPTMTTFVYDEPANEIRAYVNGVLVNTVAQTTVTVVGPGPFKVGGYSSSNSLPSNSLMDEFRLYSRALTLAEIQSLLNLHTTSSINVTACGSYTVPSGDETYSTSGTYNDTIPNTAGCDSVITVNLTVISNSSATLNVTSCGSYTVPSGDETYTISGTYNDTIPNNAGCDSLLTINVNILNHSTSTQTISACNSYTVPSGDETYTISGTYNDTIPNMAGCDSIMTINLTINTVDTNVTMSGITLTADAVGATYQWIDCSNNQPIAGETGATFIATSNGSYAVIVTENMCSDTSNCYNVTSVGMNDASFAKRFALYPNPTKGQFMITMTGEDKVFVEILNPVGQAMDAMFISGSQSTIDMNYAAGVYFVQLTNMKGERVMFKLIKE